MKKTFLSILLALALCLTLLPTAAFADETEIGGTEIGETETGAETRCTCETACAADAMNTACPVCGAAGAAVESCGKYVAPVASVTVTAGESTSTQNYETLAAAINAVQSYDPYAEAAATYSVTVTLLENCTLSQALTITNTETGKLLKFTLDLNGKTLTGDVTVGSESTKGAVVIIKDSISTATTATGKIAGDLTLIANARNNKIYLKSGTFANVTITQTGTDDFNFWDIEAVGSTTSEVGFVISEDEASAANVTVVAGNKVAEWTFSYLDENGARKTVSPLNGNYEIGLGDKDTRDNVQCTYVITENISETESIFIHEGSTIILMDGVSLNIPGGLSTGAEETCKIYVQSVGGISGAVRASSISGFSYTAGMALDYSGKGVERISRLTPCTHPEPPSDYEIAKYEYTRVDADTHKILCWKCNLTLDTVAHDYTNYTKAVSTDDGMTHNPKCVCGDTNTETKLPHSYDAATGKCRECGETIMAKVQVGGTTTYLSNLSKIDTLIGSNTATVSLLADVTKDLLVGGAELTLNLNGKTLTGALSIISGNVTVNADSGTAIGKITGNIWMALDSLTLNGGIYDGTLTIDSENSPSLTITGGTFNGTVDLGSRASVTLKGGTFTTLKADNDLKSYLAENFAFANADNESGVGEAEITQLSDVTVIEHFSTNHVDANENGKCDFCGKTLVAYLTNGSTKQYFDTFDSALSTVQTGQTLTLLGEVTLSEELTVSDNKTITLDLNGKKINSNSNIVVASGATLTLKGTNDSAITTGITVNGTLKVADPVVLMSVSVNSGGKITVNADAKFVSLSITGGTATLNSGTFSTLSVGAGETLKDKNFLGTGVGYYDNSGKNGSPMRIWGHKRFPMFP